MVTQGDYIGELGPLALASRLRRLLNRLLSDGEQVYHSLNINFRVKWFPVLNLLMGHAPMGITEIAKELHMAHPSVIEVTDELTREGLIVSRKCESDGRKRDVVMTDKGRQFCARFGRLLDRPARKSSKNPTTIFWNRSRSWNAPWIVVPCMTG